MSSRITALVLVPLILITVLWGYGLFLTAERSLYVSLMARTEASIHEQTATLFDALQEERRTSMAYLGSGGAHRTMLVQVRQETDRAASGFRALVDDEVLAEVNPSERRWLVTMRERLGSLDSLRSDVDAGVADRPSAEAGYSAVIEAAVGVFDHMTTDVNPDYGFYHQTMVSLQRAREALAAEDALLAGALANVRLTSDEHDTFVRRVGAQRALFAAAELGITDEAVQRRYRRAVESDAFGNLRALEDRLAAHGRGQKSIPFPAASWDAARTQVMDDLRHLEHAVLDAMVARAVPIAISIVAQLVGMVAAGVIIVVLSVALTWRGRRRLIRQLSELKDAALHLAEARLPKVVAQLRRGERVDIDTAAPPLEYGPDEFGQVGRAFNRVQETAVQSAIEQAELRNGVRAVFVNLARRSQGLVHRQLALLDEIERRTSDPDDLEELFAVDHLATRMRRHAEDLIILSGASPGRQWRKPVPVIDVVRSAIGEVEHYARVTVLPIAEASLAGRVVADVIHLLAELIENATRFSPPQTKVRVSGLVVPNGFVIEIEDGGLGISSEDLVRYNDRLANPPEFNPSDSARLGLFVVARLAERTGIKVHLRRSPYGGTHAIVLIPTALVTWVPSAGDSGDDGAQPTPAASASPHDNEVAVPPMPIGTESASAPEPVAETGGGFDSGSGPTPPEADPDDVELPRRVRQVSLAAELRDVERRPSKAVTMRAPEETRAMMTSYQRGAVKGRSDRPPARRPSVPSPRPTPASPGEDE